PPIERHSSPTRLSSDLEMRKQRYFLHRVVIREASNEWRSSTDHVSGGVSEQVLCMPSPPMWARLGIAGGHALHRTTMTDRVTALDRKSTRLNSSHEWIS